MNIWTAARLRITHDSTKFSPFELMFGRKTLLPIQLETNGDDPNEVLHEFRNAPALDENSALLEKLIEGQSTLIEEAKANIKAAQEKQREHYNRKHANPEAFLVGSKVLIKDFTRRKRQGGKMDFRWLGPYTIEKNLGKGAYLLQHDAGKSSKRVNGAHMKPYFDPLDDTNPPDDEPDLLDDVSLHHDSFDIQLSDLEPEGNKEAEIAEPEEDKEAEVAEPEGDKATKIAEPEGDKEAEDNKKEVEITEPSKGPYNPELKKPKASRRNKRRQEDSDPSEKVKHHYNHTQHTHVYTCMWVVGLACWYTICDCVNYITCVIFLCVCVGS